MASSALILLLLVAPSAEGTGSVTATVAQDELTSLLVSQEDAGEGLLGEMLGEDPLSPEELALLQSLDATTSTATGEEAPAWWPVMLPAHHPIQVLTRARLRETVGRSVSTALDGHPTLIGFRRAGQPTTFVDGVLLDPDFANRWLGIDPYLFDRVEIEVPGTLENATRLTSNSIQLFGLPAPLGEGVGAEVALTTRSADRSLGVSGMLSGSFPIAALSIAGSYTDAAQMRVHTGSITGDIGSLVQRVTVSSRARIFQPDEPMRIAFGIDYDRFVEEAGDERAVEGVAAVNKSWVYHGRFDFGSEELGVSVLGAHYGHNFYERDDRLDSRRRELLNLQARVLGHWWVTPSLVWRTGGRISRTTIDAPGVLTNRAKGESSRGEAFVSGSAIFDWVRASARLRVLHGQAELKETAFPAASVEATHALVEARSWWRIVGPIGLRLGGATAAYLPGLNDLRRREKEVATLLPETSLSALVGPVLQIGHSHVELIGFFTQTSDAIERSGDTLLNRGRVRLFGVESNGLVNITERLRSAFVIGWADRISSGPETGEQVPSVRGLISLRYDLKVRRAFVSMHVRGASNPLHLTSESPLDGEDRDDLPDYELLDERGVFAPKYYFRFGAMGGVDLGLGFYLRLVVENAFDTSYTAHDGDRMRPGIDLRAQLSYTYDL